LRSSSSIVVDGGNSYWGDSIRRHARLKEKGLQLRHDGSPNAKHRTRRRALASFTSVATIALHSSDAEVAYCPITEQTIELQLGNAAALAHIPFVTYSGYDDLVGVRREGVHVNKPASMSMLVATVQGLLAEPAAGASI
jgi:hypothetical protein